MKAFKSGEQVPASGIYRILHAKPHTAERREIFFQGSRFAECRECQGVLYQLESPCVPMTARTIAESAMTGRGRAFAS